MATNPVLPGYEYLLGRPLFFVFTCPYSDPYGTAPAFSAESDSTTAPSEEFFAQNVVLLAERWPDEFAQYGRRAEQKLNMLRKTEARNSGQELMWAGPSAGRI